VGIIGLTSKSVTRRWPTCGQESTILAERIHRERVESTATPMCSVLQDACRARWERLAMTLCGTEVAT